MSADLSADQRASFERDGFLVLPDFVSKDSCDRLRAQADKLVAEFDPDEQRTVFSTTDQGHARDDYFLSSGDKVRYFFEEDAFDDEGRLRQPKELSLNKLGHAMHDLDPEFARFSHTEDLAAVAHDLGFVDPLALQSMYIFKQPHIGGEVHPHIDHTFLWTEPQSVVGFWFALEDATIENGCLWAVPGSHRLAIRSRFRRDGHGGTKMDIYDATPYPREGEVPLEAKAGTMIVLHGSLPHRSGPNHSNKSRHAYTLHVIDGTARYPDDNWLQRDPDLPLRGLR
ncbi:MAG: phytanoyl-CoA dioxygenase family protein [Acidimicrobiales bacterium]